MWMKPLANISVTCLHELRLVNRMSIFFYGTKFSQGGTSIIKLISSKPEILQVKDQSLHIEGADVIRHMIDHFLT